MVCAHSRLISHKPLVVIYHKISLNRQSFFSVSSTNMHTTALAFHSNFGMNRQQLIARCAVTSMIVYLTFEHRFRNTIYNRVHIRRDLANKRPPLLLFVAMHGCIVRAHDNCPYNTIFCLLSIPYQSSSLISDSILLLFSKWWQKDYREFLNSRHSTVLTIHFNNDTSLFIFFHELSINFVSLVVSLPAIQQIIYFLNSK